MLEVKHLEKKFTDTIIPLKDVNFIVNDGDVISIIGPSGTGKSTLLRCINMLDPATKGEILLDNENIMATTYNLTNLRKMVGMVFQHFNLFNHLSVIENIIEPQVDILGVDRREAFKEAMQLLDTVGLTDRATMYPKELSGGQKQRVAIARTLAMKPKIILFDEPTSALDPMSVGEVQFVMKNLARHGTTMLIVTHDMRLAKTISTRVFYMDEGILYEEGSPKEVFDNPKKPRTKAFMQSMKTVTYEVVDGKMNLVAVNTSIDKYAILNDLTSKNTYSVQLIFEELVKEILLKEIGDKAHIKVDIIYDEKTLETTMTILYNGDKRNPEESFNIMSYDMAKSTSKSIEYFDIDDGDWTNKLVVKI